MSEAAFNRDLEALVTMLEVGALCLTENPQSTFTKAELFAEARDCAGPSVRFDDRDLNIVLQHSKFIRRAPGGRLRLA